MTFFPTSLNEVPSFGHFFSKFILLDRIGFYLLKKKNYIDHKSRAKYRVKS